MKHGLKQWYRIDIPGYIKSSGMRSIYEFAFSTRYTAQRIYQIMETGLITDVCRKRMIEKRPDISEFIKEDGEKWKI